MSTGSAVSALVDGHVAALDARPPYDPAAARALLKEAGFGAGFRVTLDCLSVASRAAACQAIAAMLERVGIKVNFQPAPAATFFPKVTQAISSFMEFGWAPGTDAWFVLNTLLRTNDGMFSGAFNGGRYANPKYDALIDAVRVEPDLARRRTLVGEVLRLIRDDVAIIPLYRRQHTWAMRPDVELVQWSNDVAELRWVRVR